MFGQSDSSFFKHNHLYVTNHIITQETTQILSFKNIHVKEIWESYALP